MAGEGKNKKGVGAASVGTSGAPENELWIEVVNVKIVSGSTSTIHLQLREYSEAARQPWRPVGPLDDKIAVDAFKALNEALDKKRKVVARLELRDGGVEVTEFAIRYAELDIR